MDIILLSLLIELTYNLNQNYAISQVKMNFVYSLDVNLYVAAESGNAKRVKQLLEIQGPEFFNYQSTCDGNNALHIAFINKHDQVVDLLLEAIRVTSTFHNFTNHMGLTHLHIACTRKDEKLIQSILDTGASIESTVCPSSPLWAGFNAMHFAASYHSVQAMKVLLEAGLDHRSKTTSGKTARDIVYQDLYDPLIIVDLLEEKETDEHRRKFSNFHIACLNEHHAVAQGFIDHGATNINSKTIQKFHAACPTPLHCAVDANSLEKVQMLLQNGAKVDCCNYEKSTPLNLAVENFFSHCSYSTGNNVKESRRFKIIELLYSAVEDKMVDHEDSFGLSYFHAAITCNDLPTVEKYLKVGKANVNKSARYDGYPCLGYTPLHMAMHFDCPEIAELLVEHGASLNVYQRYHGTPLHMAFTLKRHNFLELLLMNNVKLNILTPLDQQAILHLVLQLVYSQFDTTYDKVLHDKLLTMESIPVNIEEIDVNAKDTGGNTALHYLCYYEASYVQMLLDLGADINVKNNHGKSPFVLAEDYCWLAFVKNYWDVKALLYHHVQKLKALGLKVDREIELRCLAAEDGELEYTEHQTLEEIAKLKSTMIGDKTSLYDFVKWEPERTTVYAGCETLKNIAEDLELKKKFPSYGYLIRLQYRAATGFQNATAMLKRILLTNV